MNDLPRKMYQWAIMTYLSINTFLEESKRHGTKVSLENVSLLLTIHEYSRAVPSGMVLLMPLTRYLKAIGFPIYKYTTIRYHINRFAKLGYFEYIKPVKVGQAYLYIPTEKLVNISKRVSWFMSTQGKARKAILRDIRQGKFK